MLARFSRFVTARRRRRRALDAIRHLVARLLADVGLRRAGAGGPVEHLPAAG